MVSFTCYTRTFRMPIQTPLPAFYQELTPAELLDRIKDIKRKLKDQLIILAHHYQRPEIVNISDYRGDSLKLAQYVASQNKAKYIVYCGVHFMAESADILKSHDEIVILPDMGAGCDMADMAEKGDVAEAYEELTSVLGHDDIMPVTYVNSSAALKAFVGQKQGVVCTSTNAPKVVEWALSKRKILFFYPDEHLGRNTCKRLGIPLEQMKLWDPKKVLGGLTREEILTSKVFLWKGHCPVHLMFTAKQIDTLCAKDPEFKIITHPECSMEVVDKSDYFGSTEYIVKKISEGAPGSKWAVGTELNLVNRIAQENPDKTVVSLNPFMCLCGTMNRIDLPHLAWALSNIIEGKLQNVITVQEPTRSLAKIALENMLKLS
jgi:quinolinate synthase